ncbi:MAG: hypothetical protein NVSMB24_04240 [Mucilaginibacter sp.]
MGRWITGIQTTESAKIIDLAYLVKTKMLQKGFKKSGQLNWTSDGQPNGNIGIECSYFGTDVDYIRLYYTQTKVEVKTDLDYKIHLIEKDSNLGKGIILYMICCQSGNLCRKLYMAYGSSYFKCRQAYQNRIYYPIQRSSKLDRANSRFYEIESYFAKENKKRNTYKYNGQITKRALKNQRLEILHTKMDHLRNEAFLYSAYKVLGRTGF